MTNEKGLMTRVNYGEMVASFKKQNDGIELDFIELGMRINIAANGKFVQKDNESVTYDSIECVILSGKPNFALWGKDGSPQEDELLLTAESVDEAMAKFEELCTDPVFAAMYEKDDIQEKYLITFVMNDGNIGAINMSKTSKWEFGNYAKQLFTQDKTTVKNVVTELTTEVRKKGKNSWNVIKFKKIRLIDDNGEVVGDE